MRTDKFLIKDESYKRLIKEYEKHKELIIGVDFDGTIHDYHKEGYTYKLCHELLCNLKRIGCKIICWTAYKDHSYVTEFFLKNNLPLDGINCDGVNLNYETRKPFFNALLDDRAGLIDVYNDLKRLVDYVDSKSNLNGFLTVFIDGDEIITKPKTETIKILIHNGTKLMMENIKTSLNTIFEVDINFRNNWNIILTEFNFNNIKFDTIKKTDDIFILNNHIDMDALVLNEKKLTIFNADTSENANILKKYENELGLDVSTNHNELIESILSSIGAKIY